MKTTIAAMAVIAGFLSSLFGTTHLRAQDRSDFNQVQTTLKTNDTVTVTTGTEQVKGKMIEVSGERIVLEMKDGPRTIDVSQILKVQKRKNGVLLGALIGAGSMVPVSILISEYTYNEGGSRTWAAVPIAVGLGVGTGIDALIGSNRTVYDRTSKKRVTFAPVLNRKGDVGARVALAF